MPINQNFHIAIKAEPGRPIEVSPLFTSLTALYDEWGEQFSSFIGKPTADRRSNWTPELFGSSITREPWTIYRFERAITSEQRKYPHPVLDDDEMQFLETGKWPGEEE